MLKLFLFYLAFFVCAFLWPSIRVWLQTGSNPVVLPKSDDVAGFVGFMFKLLIVLLGLYLLVGTLKILKPIGPIALPYFADELGWKLLISSFVWVIIAQFQMGKSWRVGIDTAVKTELVAKGLFLFSRNPIFLGMLVQLIGLFLIQPDAVTATICVAAFLLISVQMRQEEEHLLKMHGGDYAQYMQVVRRWI